VYFCFPVITIRLLALTKKVLELKSVKLFFEYANSVFKKDLISLCVQGASPEDLKKPSVYEPMVFLSSMAAIEKLRYENLGCIENCVLTAGFDLGEYTSLVFSGALRFEDGKTVTHTHTQK
jgi:[acyl-carrier-protein] S-malonyltransferase